MKKTTLNLSILLSFLILNNSADATPTYKVLDLGTLGGDVSVATGINNNGQITGYSNLPGNQNYHAFVFDGTMHDIGTIFYDNARDSVGVGINDSGRVAGYSGSYNYGVPYWRAFLYDQDSEMMSAFYPDYGYFYITNNSFVYDINNHGAIIGTTSGITWLYDNGMTIIPTLQTGYGATIPMALNDNNQITGSGTVDIYGNTHHAFLYENGAINDLGTLDGLDNSSGNDINNQGQITGRIFNYDFLTSRAFIYENGTMNTLDTGGVGEQGNVWSVGKAINNSGQIVGSYGLIDTPGSDHAFLWENGMMHDLNDLLHQDYKNYVFDDAADINDDGWIVGGGYVNGEYHALLAYFDATPPCDDTDADGFCDDLDNCPLLENSAQSDADADGIGDICDSCPNDAENDSDADGICGDVDNCPQVANGNQSDFDNDGTGNECDADDDDDGVPDESDNCQYDFNPAQADFDNDGIGNICDNDIDGDNVVDADDKCLETIPGEVADMTGCSVDQLCPCDNSWKNHGAYVKCIAHATEVFLADGLITFEEKDAVISYRAESMCGKK